MDSLPPDIVPPPFTVPVPPPPAGSDRTWRPRDLILFVLYLPFAFIVAGLATFVGFAAFKPLMGWSVAYPALPGNAFFLVAFQSIFYALLFAYIYLLIALYYHVPFWPALGWRVPEFNKALQFLLGGVLLSVGIMLAPAILPDKKNFPLEQMFSSPSAVRAIGAFAVLVAPFMEELFFRGFLFAFFDKWAGLYFAVVATALLFAGLHVQEYWGAWNHVLLIVIVGFVFSIARGRTGSLVPSYLMHLAYNATQIAVLLLAPRHL